jgi:outer membrane protein assembly factor BamB
MIPREQVEATQRYRKKRRRIITFSIIGVILLIIAYILLSGFTDVIYRVNRDINVEVATTDWPVFQHDLQNTGVTGFSGTLPQGEVVWTFRTEKPIHSSPAVVDGVVYVGSEDNNLYALDAQTGEEIWRFETGSWVDASPIVVDGVVYCGSNDGNMYAINAATGTELWAYDVIYPVRGAATYADGVVYFGSDDWSVHAVDAATGEQKWEHRTENIVLSSPVVVNGVVVIGGMDGYAYCINASSGRGRLQYPTRALVPGAPVYEDGIVYLSGSNGYIYAIDPMAKNWPFENFLRKYWLASYLYGIAPKPPDLSGYLWSVYTADFLGPPEAGMFFQKVDSTSTMTLADGVFYLGADDTLVAMDRDTKQKVWSFKTGDRVLSAAVVAGDTVFFGSSDGNVYALDRTTGEALWQYRTGGPITSSAALAGDMLYVGSEDGVFYAFK